MLMGMLLPQADAPFGVSNCVVIHIGVGFCVARSTISGNAKASESGTSNSTDSHAFFYFLVNC
jgi:seryl-tRNA(Sec) selenium transferase